MKTCTHCKQEKRLDQFPLRQKGGRKQSYCKSCGDDLRWARNLKNRFGITPEDYDRMYNAQSGRCGICGTHQCETGRRFAVDHCHHTGIVRGLLCFACNVGIGKLNDDPELLRRGMEWVQRPASSGVLK